MPTYDLFHVLLDGVKYSAIEKNELFLYVTKMDESQ